MFELILIVFALILLNGFFAMSEMSVMTSRKSRLKQMSATSKRAERALALAEKPENFLSTVQIGITVIGVLTGFLGGEALGEAIAAGIQGLMPGFTYAGAVGKAPKSTMGKSSSAPRLTCTSASTCGAMCLSRLTMIDVTAYSAPAPRASARPCR